MLLIRLNTEYARSLPSFPAMSWIVFRNDAGQSDVGSFPSALCEYRE